MGARTTPTGGLYTEEELAHNARVYRIDTCAHAFVLLVFWCLSQWQAPSPTLAPGTGSVSAVTFSVILTVLAHGAWATLLANTKDKKGDRTFPLKRLVGHFGFLTHITFSILCAYATFDCAAQVGKASGLASDEFVGSLQLLVYTASIRVGTIGVVVTLLFLKLCWLDPKWQDDMAKHRERVPNIGVIQFWGHFVPAIYCVLDVFVYKDVSLVLDEGGGYMDFIYFNTAFGAGFLAYTEVCFLINGGVYPYPFMTLLNTPVKKMGFVLGVLVFTFFIASVVRKLASIKALVL